MRASHLAFNVVNVEQTFEHLVSHGQESKMSHEVTISNIGLFGKAVLPVIKT